MALETFGPLQSVQPTRVAVGCCPAPQCAQAPTAPLASLVFCLPGGQVAHAVRLPGEYLPAGQSWHAAVPLFWNLPALQGVQSLCCELGCEPSTQTAHAVLPLVDTLPLPQAEQMWFAVLW